MQMSFILPNIFISMKYQYYCGSDLTLYILSKQAKRVRAIYFRFENVKIFNFLAFTLQQKKMQYVHLVVVLRYAGRLI